MTFLTLIIEEKTDFFHGNLDHSPLPILLFFSKPVDLSKLTFQRDQEEV